MLKEWEVKHIKQAQQMARVKKARYGNIHCPFYFIGNMDACYLCHKWMGTDSKQVMHPCEAMDSYLVRERFWRKP